MYQDWQCAWNINTTRKENPLRKVIASPFVTLDGFIAGSDGALDWSVGDEAFDREQLPALLRRVDMLRRSHPAGPAPSIDQNGSFFGHSLR
jgi:hypothetical protein